ncbi:MAG: hypothetical protein WC294_10520 [Methanoregula sp.]|jgi:hypothetical protein
MNMNQPKTTKSGKSEEIPTEVPEPDQIASGTAGTGQENTSYSGRRGNMILYLADRQDRVAGRQNKKIERIEQRLTVLEERQRERLK